MLLIDRMMPHCDFVERHSSRSTASAERLYAAIRTADLTSHPITRTLLALRGLGRTRQTFSLDDFVERGFVLLAEDPPRELVLGIEGPFWQPSCALRSVDAQRFESSVPSGVARAAWNFLVENGRITTETRILCADDARWKFTLYWMAVRPFSGLIRRLMLRAIRREAER